MRINEFIEYMGKNVNRTMKDEQIVSLVQKQLEIKKYLPINEKKELIDKIIYQSAYYQDGMLKIGAIDCYIYFTMFTIDAYTNLEIDNVEACYDMLSEAGMTEVLIAAIGHEYSDVNVLLNLKKDELLSDNSIDAQFSKFFNDISSSVNDVKDTIDGAIKNLNIDKESAIKLIQMFLKQ